MLDAPVEAAINPDDSTSLDASSRSGSRTLTEFDDDDKKEVQEQKMGYIKTFFSLFKGFIGTGILFLPNGFKDGGWLFSIIILIFSVIISYICMDKMIKSKVAHGGTYMDLC